MHSKIFPSLCRQICPVFLLLLLCVIPAGVAEGQGKPGVEAEILVDLTLPGEGWMEIQMQWRGLPGQAVFFKQRGVEGEHEYRGVGFVDGDGETLPFLQRGDRYELGSPDTDEIRVRYRVRPGGWGRHGHQGHVSEEFAVFDGRVFLQPGLTRELTHLRVRFLTPPGWRVAAPWQREGDWWVVGQRPGVRPLDLLAEGCVGLGPFESRTEQHGNTELRVHVWRDWPESHKKYLQKGTAVLFEYFQQELGFDPGAPYSVVWTPTRSGARIFGGSYATGTCYEFPEPQLRNWELLAHRIGHALNKYAPTGMLLRDARDQWFLEGWASYIEVRATSQTGLAEDEGSWNGLYDRYRQVREDHPEQDLALGKEPEAEGEAREYLHYTKGPLVVRMLDEFVRARSGGSLEEFMKEAYREFGAYQKPLPLRRALDVYVGAPLDDFWAAFVDRPGAVIPMWGEILDSSWATAAGKPSRAPLWIGDEPVSGDYLFHLAATGGFETVKDLVEFLVAESLNRAVLAEAGIHLLPPPLRGRRHGLSPSVRHDLARVEADWKWLDVLERQALESESLADSLRPRVDTSHPDGAALAALSEGEERYQRARGDSGVASIVLKAGRGDVEEIRSKAAQLAFDAEDTVVVETRWIRSLPEPGFQLQVGNEDPDDRRLVMEPGWSRSWSIFSPSERPSEPGPVRFRVLDGEKILIERVFWQR